MHIGFAPVFMNDYGLLTDREVYQRELALCDLAEPLGFDSIWEPEHHFTGYEMTPDVIQFLTYMAGRTKKVKLGSMVVVLPWHDPVRVAEQITLLDYFSDGRAILGIGRGLGAIEFGGFRVDMNNSREIFTESAEMIVSALRTGVLEYNGKHIKQPRRELRPAPFKSFEGRTYGAGLSRETMPILARLGVGNMIFPLKSWDDVRETLADYQKTWSEVRPGTLPPKTVLASFCVLNKDAGKAKDAAYKYIGACFRTVIKHYDMGGENFAKTKGYELYAQNAALYRGESLEKKVEEFVELMVWGTPDQCMEKLHKIDDHIDIGALITHFSFGGMPYDMAEDSMRLFAKEVLPQLKSWDTGSFAEVTEAPVATAAAE